MTILPIGYKIHWVRHPGNPGPTPPATTGSTGEGHTQERTLERPKGQKTREHVWNFGQRQLPYTPAERWKTLYG